MADKDIQKLAEQSAQQFTSAVNRQIDKFIQPRTELTQNQFYYYPMELNGTAAETGLPFMRFGFGGTNGTNNVAIFLYQPPGVTVNDNAQYTAMNVGTIRGGLNLLKNIRDEKKVTRGDQVALGLMSKEKLLSPGSSVDKITSGAAMKAGIASNPYTRTAFEGIDVRGYTFAFRLVAESAKEQNQIRAIERTFRKFLYPRRAGAVALVYPPLCDITFYSEGKRNEYMPNIKPSYLTSLEAVYNETATAMHKGTGAPLELNLTMSFQEERVLTRDDLYRGQDGKADDNTIFESDGFAPPYKKGSDVILGDS
jgi:hypothetical protein